MFNSKTLLFSTVVLAIALSGCYPDRWTNQYNSLLGNIQSDNAILEESGNDEESEKNGFSVPVEGLSKSAITDEEGNYFLSDVPVNKNLKLLVCKDEVFFPLYLEIPDSLNVFETESKINLSETSVNVT